MRPILAATLLTACGASAGNDIEFRGELPVLEDYAFDTGLQPSSGPVQVQFTFSAGGGLKASASAVAGGTGDMVAVAAVPGSGTYSLEAHFKAAAMLHVDVSGMTYDGPIPGIENLDIAFGGETTFDPFLMDSEATVTAMLPETKLPDIPLPGGLPGHLELTIAAGSTMTSTLRGTCANHEANTATFTAMTSTSANIILKSKVVLQVPIVGDKDFGLPDLEIPVPEFSIAMDLGAHAFAGGGEPPTGTLAQQGLCGKGDGPDGPGGPDGPDGPGGGSNVCEFVDTTYDDAWHPPNGFDQRACNPAQLDGFASACLGASATTASCQEFQSNNPTCGACLLTRNTSPGYGPIIVYDTFANYNYAACIIQKAPAERACAESFEQYFACVDAACNGCGDATQAEQDACWAEAGASTCAAEVDEVNACFDRLSSNNHPATTCFVDYNFEEEMCGGF